MSRHCTCRNSNQVRPLVRLTGACTVAWMKCTLGAMAWATCSLQFLTGWCFMIPRRTFAGP
eukprot:scaffold30924_cov17-Tisochrysis_lutea.AAC.3